MILHVKYGFLILIAKESRPESIKMIAVSIAEQSRASIAAKYGVSPQSVHQKLKWFFLKKLGIDIFLDTSFARDLSLFESAQEFVARYQSNPQQNVKRMPLLASSCPGTVFRI